jgi:purine-cytosine permease-like protein
VILTAVFAVLAGYVLARAQWDYRPAHPLHGTVLWATLAFLLAVVLGTVANNAVTAYSSGLALQAVGLRIRRSRSVALDGTIGVAMTLYTLDSNFLDTVASLLQVMVALLGPAWPSTPPTSCSAATATTAAT